MTLCSVSGSGITSPGVDQGANIGYPECGEQLEESGKCRSRELGESRVLGGGVDGGGSKWQGTLRVV